MSKLKAIIIEDEHLAAELLAKNVQAHEQIELIGKFDNGFSGLKGIQELKPDLVFLDIQLEDGTGFDILEKIEDSDESTPQELVDIIIDNYNTEPISTAGIRN